MFHCFLTHSLSSSCGEGLSMRACGVVHSYLGGSGSRDDSNFQSLALRGQYLLPGRHVHNIPKPISPAGDWLFRNSSPWGHSTLEPSTSIERKVPLTPLSLSFLCEMVRITWLLRRTRRLPETRGEDCTLETQMKGPVFSTEGSVGTPGLGMSHPSGHLTRPNSTWWLSSPEMGFLS